MNAQVSSHRPVRVLPPDVAEKIAAGEVIERPFSVVKELVENAIDAGARNITVELESGGLRRVSVIDDGHGIAESDVLAALERHGTSKISEADDLWRLHTLGFRGEALPSIAAISLFTMETRRKGEPGRNVVVEGGKPSLNRVLAANAQVPYPSGTRTSAEHLFFNVPARLKFLKAKSSEAAAVRDLLLRLAVSRPQVAFTMVSEGRRTLQLPATDLLDERVAAILDVPPESLEAVAADHDGIQVRGYVDQDGRASNSKDIYLAVNGRMVKDKLLQQAVMVALRPVMMEGEYPRAFLEVRVPTEDVDANVHPTKTEVRFHKPRDVFQVIGVALAPVARAHARVAYEARGLGENLPPTASTPLPRPAVEMQPALLTEHRTVFRSKPVAEPLFQAGAGPALDPATTAPTAVTLAAPRAHSRFSALHYVGQVKNTYLLFQDGDGLVLIDQHAAHERINYEKLKTQLLTDGMAPQPLLIGATVKMSAEDIALALDCDKELARFGFEVEAFGGQHLIIRSRPAGLDESRVGETFQALLTHLREHDGEAAHGDPTRLSPRLERLINTAACHSSIRAGQPLSVAEAEALVAEMEATPSSLNCPHGRPASIRLNFSQIEGLFGRSG